MYKESIDHNIHVVKSDIQIKAISKGNLNVTSNSVKFTMKDD